jgi:hypothetical protein
MNLRGGTAVEIELEKAECKFGRETPGDDREAPVFE